MPRPFGRDSIAAPRGATVGNASSPTASGDIPRSCKALRKGRNGRSRYGLVIDVKRSGISYGLVPCPTTAWPDGNIGALPSAREKARPVADAAMFTDRLAARRDRTGGGEGKRG